MSPSEHVERKRTPEILNIPDLRGINFYTKVDGAYAPLDYPKGDDSFVIFYELGTFVQHAYIKPDEYIQSDGLNEYSEDKIVDYILKAIEVAEKYCTRADGYTAAHLAPLRMLPKHLVDQIITLSQDKGFYQRAISYELIPVA